MKDIHTPPHSPEYEQGILGAILSDGSIFYKVLEILGSQTDVFYAPNHQMIYDRCVELYNDDKPIDLITVIERLDTKGELDRVGGKEYLIDLAESGMLSVHAVHYAKELKEKLSLRRLIRTCMTTMSESYKGENLEQIAGDLQSQVADITLNDGARVLTSAQDISNITWKALEQRGNTATRGLSTGFTAMDSITRGLHKSDLIIVAARPSMGKTAFCLSVASHAAINSGKTVAIFSLEMSKEQVLDRIIAAEAGVPMTKENLNDDDWTNLTNAHDIFSRAPLHIDDSPQLTVVDIKAKLRALRTGDHPLGLVVIDYLQLMHDPGKKNQNETQEISQISRGLKILARELDVPVIVLSQLSRAVESRNDKRPMLSDLRSSGSIEQDADIVMFLYRDEYYNEQSTAKGLCEVNISKYRNGATGKFELKFIPQTTKFEDKPGGIS